MTDISQLSREQLLAIAQVRGQAIVMNADLDEALIQKLASGEFTIADFDAFQEGKERVLAGLTTAEEKIMAGQTQSSAAN